MHIERHYGMDWLRIGAFALLILYHVGMVFVPWGYHVKTEHPAQWVMLPMLATNAWRMPLLLAVSGFATAMLLARQDRRIGRFLAGRTPRLLLPLVLGMAVIVPPQTWVELTTQHGYGKSYPAFWLGDYFAFEPIDGIIVPTSEPPVVPRLPAGLHAGPRFAAARAAVVARGAGAGSAARWQVRW